MSLKLAKGTWSCLTAKARKTIRFNKYMCTSSISDRNARVDSTLIPLLSAEEVYKGLSNVKHANTSNFLGFYSSLVGGITTDPAAMLIPIDDHMVHRGHGVFDTATVWDGYLYELDPHLDRILLSSKRSKIIPPFSREEMREILIQTASASGIKNGHLRFWLSVGPGGFSLSTKECPKSTFYAMAIAEKSFPDPKIGVKVITSTVPIKPPLFATVKSVNYLPNALNNLEAEEAGAIAGIWLDEEGNIGEGQSMNCCFVTQEGILLVPSFDKILAGCTMKRVLKLVESLLDGGINGSLSSLEEVKLEGIKVGTVTLSEARNAKEMMLCGSGVLVTPVVQWDEQIISNGNPGPVTLKLRELMEKDLKDDSNPQRIKIPSRIST